MPSSRIFKLYLSYAWAHPPSKNAPNQNKIDEHFQKNQIHIKSEEKQQSIVGVDHNELNWQSNFPLKKSTSSLGDKAEEIDTKLSSSRELVVVEAPLGETKRHHELIPLI